MLLTLSGVERLPALSVPMPMIPGLVTNVANFGAVGDNTTNNAVAIQNAINAVSAAGGGTVRIPATSNAYLCGPLTLKSSINLQLDAGAVLRALPLSQYPGGTVSPPNFISASSLHDVSLTGGGAIDGQGSPWWPYAYTNGANRPVLVNLSTCTRVLVQGITLSNSPAAHLVVKGNAGNVTIQNVTFRAPSSGDPVNPSHNTDAIDLAETNAVIRDCSISVGDDNVAVGSSASLSRDILITNCACGAGHGISIGSYTSGGVSNMTVINCTFTNTDQGIRIKSDRDRGGVVQNIGYFNLSMSNVMYPILIYAAYTNTDPVFHSFNNLTPAQAATYPSNAVTSKTPIYRNLTISNVTATAQSGRLAGMIWGLPEMAVSNVTLSAVRIAGSKTFAAYFVRNLALADAWVSVPAGVSQVSFCDAQITVMNTAAHPAAVSLDGDWGGSIPGNTLALLNAPATLQNTNALDGVPVLSFSNSVLTVSNQLSLPAASTVNFVAGTNAARLAVTGSLALNSTLHVAAGPGFGPGNYPLATAGSLGGNPVLGTTPATGHTYLYALAINGAKELDFTVALPPPPQLDPPRAAGTNLVLSGTGGVAGTPYFGLRSTNAALPLAQWTPVVTNVFDSAGRFTFSNGAAVPARSQFYRLKVP